MRIIDTLPQLYGSLLPSFFSREVPPESKATCSSCAMCEGNAAMVAPVDGVSRLFRPDTKCCTFHPRLPNYLVGALLSDTRPELEEGRRRIRSRIASRVGTSPQWVQPPARYNLLYANARHAFGRSRELRCPYFDSDQGNCTIWPFREAVCSTYFCKYVAGADGRRFWMELKQYLALAEVQLSRLALLKLMPDYLLGTHERTDATTGPLSAADLDESPAPANVYRERWRTWEGREEELYRSCYEVVRAADSHAVQRALGLDHDIETLLLEHLYSAANGGKLPPRLKLNPAATVTWLPDGSVALACYSEVDALALPGDAYALLARFTGAETVEEVRRTLREQHRSDLDDSVLLALYRHRVLIEA